MLRRVPRLACSVAKHAVSLPPTVEDTFHKISFCRSTTDVIVSAKTVSHGLRDVLISRDDPCGLAHQSHVHRTVNRSHCELALIASNTAHAIDRPQLPQARLLRRREGRLKENASTSLDLQSCLTACKLQMTFTLLPQFCQLVWLGVLQSR